MSRIALILVLLLTLSAAAAQADLRVQSWTSFYPSPHTGFNGAPLDYIFQATSGVRVLNYNSPRDTLKPLILVGAIESRQTLFGVFNYWSTFRECGNTGVVAEEQMVCFMGGRALCPAADAWWRSKTKARYGFTGIAVDVSPHYRAQCVNNDNGPCPAGTAAAAITVDLGDGSVSREELLPGAVMLNRMTQKDGMYYNFEQWSFEERSPVLRRRGGRTTRVMESREEPQLRTLRIEIPELPDGHVATPTVRFDSNARQLSRRKTRSLVRAEFSPSGILEEVENLLGDAIVGRRLAEDLEIKLQGPPHRAAVYALFETDDRGVPHLVTAVSVLPRCCCGATYCR